MNKRFPTLLLAGLALSGCQQNPAKPGETWTCTAKNLQSADYSGGKTAYVHLSGYGRGNDYPVTPDGDGKVTGTTGDGTPFTCNRQGK